MFLIKLSFRKSIVSVELEAITRDESVDIEAERTRSTTSPIRTSGRYEIIVGIIASNPSASTFIWSENNLPKPPKK